MRLYSLYFTFFIFTSFLLGCSEDPNNCNEYFENGKISIKATCDDQGVYQGELNEFYQNGKIRIRKFFVDGLEQDTTQEYHSNGTIKRIIPILDGKMQGRVKWFRKDGTLEKEADYDQGLLYGEELRYYEDGKQISRRSSYKYDILNGPYAKYATNGALTEDGEYYNYMRFGQWKQYRADGSLSSVFTYSYDKKNGHFAIYKPSGLPYVTGVFSKGLLNGEVSFYDKEGSIVQQQNWINGEHINYNSSSGMPRTFPENQAAFKVGKLTITIDGDSVAVK